jgi:hypothetical protein
MVAAVTGARAPATLPGVGVAPAAAVVLAGVIAVAVFVPADRASEPHAVRVRTKMRVGQS